jgi:hypothetical protein
MNYKAQGNFRLYILEETTNFSTKNYLLVDSNQVFESNEEALE